jgi:galactokinase
VNGADRNDEIRAFGPGRVNVIGEHTDYNDGLCLPFAIRFGVTVAVRPGDDAVLDVHALDLGEHDVVDLRSLSASTGWRSFVHGTVAELQRAGYDIRGGQLTIAGSVPRGSGLSSSAALEVALALALLAHSGHREPDRRELARLCSRVENLWVGAETGLLDQLAALFGRTNFAMRLDMRSLAVKPVPLHLGEWRFVIVDSGVAHVHAGSGYNARRDECRRACAALGIASLRDADRRDVASLPPPLDRRAQHVIEENARVEAAVRALSRGNLPVLGRLIDASHASLRDLYEVSVPEVDATVERLKAAGAAGARMVGGGFGGSVLALLPPNVAAPPHALDARPGPAAGVL